MESLNDVKKCMVLFFLFSLMAACGGGGGGSEADGELPFTGNTNPIVISSANATRVAAYVFSSFDLAVPIPEAAVSTAAAYHPIGLLPLLHMLQDIPRFIADSRDTLSAGLPVAAVKVDETEACYPFGRIRLRGSLDEQDGTGTLTLTYDGCQDGGTFINGTVTWQIDAADVSADHWIPLDSTFFFKKITLIDSELNILLGGTMREQIHLNSETLTLNVVLQDKLTERMQQTENVVIVSTYVGNTLSETISGRFYDSIDGFIDMATLQPLQYEPYYDAQYPSSGRLELAGAGNARLRVTVLSEMMVQIALDADGDMSYETVGEIPWMIIAVAGTDANDADADGLPDSWETTYGLSSVTFADAGEDADADGLSNYDEYLLGTDPTGSDSDDDGMPDGWEAAYGLNPLSAADSESDLDGDGAANLQEYTCGTDPADNTATPADLAVSTGVSLDIVSARTLFAYTVNLTNQGPGSARGVRLTDTLPEGAEIFTPVPGVFPAPWPWDCIVAVGSLTCNPVSGIMADDEEVSLQIPVIAPTVTGVITNGAMVESTTLDYDSANDSAAAEATVAEAVLSQVDLAIDGEEGVDGLERPFRLAVSPDGKHVYVPGIVGDALVVFARDLVDGSLAFVEAQREGLDTPGEPDYPKAAMVSPDGSNVYVVTEWSSGVWVGSVVAYSRDADTGRLTHIDTYREDVSTGAQAFAVTVSRDGESVYAARPNDGALAVFRRDTLTGRLTFSAAVTEGVNGIEGIAGVSDIVLSPDDAFLYAAGSLCNAIAVFSRGPDGMLDYAGRVDTVFSPQSMAVSSDERHLYAAGGGGLAIFDRNTDSGLLTLQTSYADGENGIIGLEGMCGLAIAPDGKYVYVAASYDSALGVFARDMEAGTLRFIEVQKNGVGGVEGLGVSQAVAVSPDSAFVYVSASSDDALSVFRVDLDAVR